MLDSVFDRFVEKSPISVISRGMMERALNPQLLDNGTSQHLIGAHTLCPGALRLNFAFIQILQDMATNDRGVIEDLADRLDLLVLSMILNVRHQGHLFLPFFAHFMTGSFSAFVVILVCYNFPILSQVVVKCQHKMRFFS